MARYRGQMALYEAMQKSRLKPGSAVTPMESRPKPEPKLEPQVELEPQAAAAEVQSVDVTVDATVDSAVEAAVAETAPVEELTPASPAVRWQRPRRIQLNAGQLELTIPYPLVGAIILALILIILAAYRWGQSGVPTP
jgi:hypothetical protein